MGKLTALTLTPPVSAQCLMSYCQKNGSPQIRLAEAKDALERALEFLGGVDDSIYLDSERLT